MSDLPEGAGYSFSARLLAISLVAFVIAEASLYWLVMTRYERQLYQNQIVSMYSLFSDATQGATHYVKSCGESIPYVPTSIIDMDGVYARSLINPRVGLYDLESGDFLETVLDDRITDTFERHILGYPGAEPLPLSNYFSEDEQLALIPWGQHGLFSFSNDEWILYRYFGLTRTILGGYETGDCGLGIVVVADASEVYFKLNKFRIELIAALLIILFGFLVLEYVVLTLSFTQFNGVMRHLLNVSEEKEGVRRDRQIRYPKELAPLASATERQARISAAQVGIFHNALDSIRHDVGRPLAAIQMSVARLPEIDDDVNDQVQRIDSILGGYLDMALLTRTSTVSDRCLVKDVADQVRKDVSFRHSDKTLRFDMQFDAELEFFVSAQVLYLILDELVENAAKYGNGLIVLSAFQGEKGRSAEEFEIRIEDNGAGIDEKYHAHVVQKGARLDETASGSGEGLFTITRMVSLLGGDLTIGRSDYGGAKVTVVV